MYIIYVYLYMYILCIYLRDHINLSGGFETDPRMQLECPKLPSATKAFQRLSAKTASAGTSQSKDSATVNSIDWFFREKLQENPICHRKIYGFL